MIIYIIVALFPLLVGMAYDMRATVGISQEELQTKRQIRIRWWWLFIAALPMFTLIALRHFLIGADTSVYLKFFKEMVDTPWEHIFIVNEDGYRFEVGFVVFEKLLTHVTHNPEVYQVIYTAIYLVSIVTFANNLEKHNFAFLYIFATIGLYTFMFTGVRQCLAMCICLWSYPFIKKRKLIWFLLLLLLAFMFHKSAILFIAAYFIYNRKIGWINTIIYAIFATLAYIYIDVIQEWFNDALDYDYGIERTGNGIIFFSVMAMVTAFSLFTIVYYRKHTPEFAGMINIGIIALVMWLLRLVTRVAERPSFYFMFFSAAMLCYALDAPPEGRDKVVFRVLVYGAFMALYIYKFLTSFVTLVPYRWFF